MLKGQYFSLKVLVDEQKHKSPDDPYEGDIERLEKIRNTLKTALLAIDKALERLASACARCNSKCGPVTRVCSTCSICSAFTAGALSTSTAIPSIAEESI